MVITPIQLTVATPAQKTQDTTTTSISPNVNKAENTIANFVDSISLTGVSGQFIESSNLRGASLSLSGLNTALETAQSGIKQINDIINNLRNIVEQSANGGDNVVLAAEFQKLTASVNKIASNTNFSGKKLLNGSFSSNGISIQDLSISGLFGSDSLDLNFSDISSVLSNAKNIIDNANSNVKDALSQTNFANASVETVIANNIAAKSILSNEDLANGLSSSITSDLIATPNNSVQAQTSKLPTTLLSLLGS